MKAFAFSFFILCFLVLDVSGQNWPQFRGPGASGVVEGTTRGCEVGR